MRSCKQVAGGWELAAITQYASGASLSFYQNGLSENDELSGEGFDGTALPGTGSLTQLFGFGSGWQPAAAAAALGTKLLRESWRFAGAQSCRLSL